LIPVLLNLLWYLKVGIIWVEAWGLVRLYTCCNFKSSCGYMYKGSSFSSCEKKVEEEV